VLWIASIAVASGAKGNQSVGIVFTIPFVFADVVYFNSIRASTEGASVSIPAAYFIAFIRPIFPVFAAGAIPFSLSWIGVDVIG
jgi:hypothetical protein